MSSSVASIATWQEHVGELLPSLSKSEAAVLGLLSYGIVILDGCGLTRLSEGLAKIEKIPAPRLRQRLREFYYEAEAKRGKKRREVKVEECFGELLGGILAGWEGKKELALALDASTLGERFTVLNISVVYRGCGMPVAWKITRAMEPGAWRPYWEELLEQLRGVVPDEWKVIVMADRGLYAPWLYRAIQALGWHPMLRVNESLSFRAAGEEQFHPMGERVQRRGRGWRGKGEWSEQGERMEGTVLIRWEKGYEEQLAVVTDLEEQESNAAWYQMRFWIEDEYKDHKSGGWGWEQTKMEDPRRAERLWLAMAVAMQMAVLLGGEQEANQQEQKRRAGAKLKGKRRVGRPAKACTRPRGREQSCLMRGQQAILAAVVRAEEIPFGHVVSEVWPVQTYPVSKPTRSWVKQCKEKAAKKRYEKNKQARVAHQEQRKLEKNQVKPEKKDRPAQPPKHVQRREQVKQERETKQLLIQQRREEHQQRRQQQREEREQEKEQKLLRRLQAREQREQERAQRQRWHAQIQAEREERQRRKTQRLASHSQLPPASLSASSGIFSSA
jgi:hypothetical protein